MKKAMYLGLVVFLLVSVFTIMAVNAQDSDAVGAQKLKKHVKMMGEGKMLGEGKMMEWMHGGGAKTGMMGMMMKKEMISSSDGGVIILSGNKLLKYDKNLELVKEVEIKMDFEGMQKMMKEMKEICPMGKMTKDDEVDKDNE